ncbi:MAG TPA: hypothetical protein VEX62_12645 [Candidatus Limnocylindrales bacterium]|nr:hypothetical protein [Candidatus Limnocylindrales bacterium]
MTDEQAPSEKRRKRKKKFEVGVSIGGAMAGLEQAVFRTLPPIEEVVAHARRDDPIPTGDGGFVVIEIPEPVK